MLLLLFFIPFFYSRQGLRRSCYCGLRRSTRGMNERILCSSSSSFGAPQLKLWRPLSLSSLLYIEFKLQQYLTHPIFSRTQILFLGIECHGGGHRERTTLTHHAHCHRYKQGCKKIPQIRISSRRVLTFFLHSHICRVFFLLSSHFIINCCFNLKRKRGVPFLDFCYTPLDNLNKNAVRQLE